MSSSSSYPLSAKEASDAPSPPSKKANGRIVHDAPSLSAGEESVQPSTQLITLLHRKLRDHSIVPAFERHRSRHLIEGLVRPRWVLHNASSEDGHVSANAGSAKAATQNDGKMTRNKNDSSASTNATSKNDGKDSNAYTNSDNIDIGKQSDKKEPQVHYNTIPKRNYIDLRVEQNKMFADNQCIQCHGILSKLQSSTSSNNSQQWKKQVDTFQSLLNEGLAACPNHEGLLNAEREYMALLQKRIDSISGRGDGIDGYPTSNVIISKNASNGSRNANVDKEDITAQLPDPNNMMSQPKKGAEGRAQAAMRDALMERSFLQGGAGNDEKSDVKYPLLSANDEYQAGDALGKEDSRDQDAKNSSGDSSVDQDSRSRRRKRSKHKYKKYKRGKRRHRDKRKRKRERSSRRSRSESRSTSSRARSRSRSVSSSQSKLSASYRNRKDRRKERKKRSRPKHHKRSRGERYDSGDSGDDEPTKKDVPQNEGQKQDANKEA